MKTGRKHTVVFAERIDVHGRTPLSLVPAPILGDIAVRAARMRGEKAVQLLWADGPELARIDLIRTLRSFHILDDGMFIGKEPAYRLRPKNWREDLNPGFQTPSFREPENPTDDPSRGLAMLASWCERAGDNVGDWLLSSDSTFVLPWFKGVLAQGAAKPWTDSFAEAGVANGPHPLPLGHLRTVPAKACSEGLFPIDLLSSGILARNYLEHLDPQWLRFQLASWFRGGDRDWEMDVDTFFRQGGALLLKRVAHPALNSIGPLCRDFNGRIAEPGDNAREMLESVRSRADVAIKAYSEWRFADAVKEACAMAGEGNVFVFMHAPWNRANDESVHADYSACLIAFRMAAICLAPVLPDFALRVARIFGEPEFSFADIDRVPEKCIAAPWTPLFPELVADSFAAMVGDALQADNRAIPQLLASREFRLYYRCEGGKQ